MNDELKRFDADVKSDEALMKEIQDANISSAAALAEFANAKGFNFSEADLDSVQGELSEDDLDNVSGGGVVIFGGKNDGKDGVVIVRW